MKEYSLWSEEMHSFQNILLLQTIFLPQIVLGQWGSGQTGLGGGFGSTQGGYQANVGYGGSNGQIDFQANANIPCQYLQPVTQYMGPWGPRCNGSEGSAPPDVTTPSPSPDPTPPSPPPDGTTSSPPPDATTSSPPPDATTSSPPHRYVTKANFSTYAVQIPLPPVWTKFDTKGKTQCRQKRCFITFLQDLTEESNVQLEFQWYNTNQSRQFVNLCEASRAPPGSLLHTTFLLATTFVANGTTECPIKAGRYNAITSAVPTFITDEPFPASPGTVPVTIHEPPKVGENGEEETGRIMVEMFLRYNIIESSTIDT